ncbi:Synaptotagmin-like protein 1 [Bagarius yarrelli]|uniref:Synaptotagmin-like protein 1 n=1 Tax=Bagarius yarrelli TaxID=175774 RepID=A0A556TPE5_BAGYA|nr:Synaptotagmin-like protein 1 [Bagarius yarrelli]
MEQDDILELGHLSEDEQTQILTVLLRDNELRNRDEGRISKLKQEESDPVRLHFLTGAWFNEQRVKRYQKRGSDVVQNSIRRKRRDKDLPVVSVFEEQKVQRQENTTEVNIADLEVGEILRKEIKIEEKKRESPNLSVAPEPRPRTKRSAKIENIQSEDALEVVSKDITEGSVADSEALEDRSLPNTTSSLQADSDGDIDSGSTELDYTTFGSVNNLYSNHTMSGSMMSLYSVGDFGSVSVTGQIQFSLKYDSRKEELYVHVCRCQELAPARNNRSDPYVKLYLLPDNTSRSKRKTSVKRKTLNPVYDETLKVQMNPETVLERGTILLTIKFIPPGFEDGGFLLTGELHIWLKEIIGLLPPKRGTTSIFVKSVILPDESGVSGQQTRVVRGSVSPVFNHTMVYDGLQSTDLTQACAEITVWNSSSCLGGMRLSTGSGLSYGQKVHWMDSTEEEISVWKTVIQNPNSWVDVTLPVRTNLQQC